MLQVTEAGRRLIWAALHGEMTKRAALPVSLAGPKPAKRRKLSRQRFEAILHRTLDLMKSWRTSKFEFEGPARYGIRRGLILQGGWRWHDADAAAAEITEKALSMMGAVRPTWDQGQPEIGDNSLTIRTRCVNEGCGNVIPDDRLVPGRTKYCSDNCGQAARARWNRLHLERMSRVERLAEIQARSQAKRAALCVRCDTHFLADKAGQIFCSVECQGLDRRTVEHKTCEQCGTLWRPRQVTKANRFCSAACLSDFRATLRRERVCEGCGSAFQVGPYNKGQRFCGRACAHEAARLGRRPSIVCQEITT